MDATLAAVRAEAVATELSLAAVSNPSASFGSEFRTALMHAVGTERATNMMQLGVTEMAHTIAASRLLPLVPRGLALAFIARSSLRSSEAALLSDTLHQAFHMQRGILVLVVDFDLIIELHGADARTWRKVPLLSDILQWLFDGDTTRTCAIIARTTDFLGSSETLITAQRDFKTVAIPVFSLGLGRAGGAMKQTVGTDPGPHVGLPSTWTLASTAGDDHDVSLQCFHQLTSVTPGSPVAADLWPSANGESGSIQLVVPRFRWQPAPMKSQLAMPSVCLRSAEFAAEPALVNIIAGPIVGTTSTESAMVLLEVDKNVHITTSAVNINTQASVRGRHTMHLVVLMTRGNAGSELPRSEGR